MANATNKTGEKDAKFGRFLSGVERVGNKLPDTVVIFIVLDLAILLVSGWAGFSIGRRSIRARARRWRSSIF